MLLALAAALAMLFAMAGPPGAGAQGPDQAEQANCATGRTVPASKISIQLYTFNRYIDFGERADEAPDGAPGPEATRAERLEFVLRVPERGRLSEHRAVQLPRTQRRGSSTRWRTSTASTCPRATCPTARPTGRRTSPMPSCSGSAGPARAGSRRRGPAATRTRWRPPRR